MIIGIGGVSRSGKSKLAQYLVSVLEGSTQVFDQDNFIKPIDQLFQIHGRTNWELPTSLDHHKLLHAVLHCKADHKIIEGIFAFDFEELIDLYDTSIILRIPYSEFVDRRKREIRWGHEPRWYIEYVWNEYHRRTSRMNFEDLITLQGLGPLTDQLKEIWP